MNITPIGRTHCGLLRRLVALERRNIEQWREAQRVFEAAGVSPDLFRPVVERAVAQHREDVTELEVLLGRLCGATNGSPKEPTEVVPMKPRPGPNGR